MAVDDVNMDGNHYDRVSIFELAERKHILFNPPLGGAGARHPKGTETK